ncbi:hypothetical protein L1N85_16370 [Paenibacillus alkaliterrae]|uniref:hypothetical protein n=1 Tax=Paenibacillus alkaliterrae TaxID=320909 RepID=UPI001F1F13DA|nr:hypothetical protein [Paenibacillus alkaliterrae]MCF2939994.1 hypothetical protein [Paenibacillus alkaliterrae]
MPRGTYLLAGESLLKQFKEAETKLNQRRYDLPTAIERYKGAEMSANILKEAADYYFWLNPSN